MLITTVRKVARTPPGCRCSKAGNPAAAPADIRIVPVYFPHSLDLAGDKRPGRSWAERNRHRNWAVDRIHIREAELTRRDSAEVGSSSSPSPCRQSSPVRQLPGAMISVHHRHEMFAQ